MSRCYSRGEESSSTGQASTIKRERERKEKKRGEIMQESNKPISYNTIKKNKKLDFFTSPDEKSAETKE
jgi:hypothetical protein